MPSFLSCLAYLQAVKDWGIVGLSFFLSITWRWVFALRASRNCYNVSGKRKTSCFCLLRMVYSHCSPSLFVLPAPKSYKFFMYIYRDSVEKVDSLVLMQLLLLFLFFPFHPLHHLQLVVSEVLLLQLSGGNWWKKTTTISHHRITIVFFLTKNIAPYHSDICYSSLVIVETLMKSISLHNCSVVFISATISLNGLAWSFIRETHHPLPRLKKQQLCGNTSWFIRAGATGQCESVQFIANCHFYMIGL